MIPILNSDAQRITIGIDVGSTTTKTVVLNPEDESVLFSSYRRHHAKQASSVREILQEIKSTFPNADAEAIITGSGGLPISEALGLPFAQEVISSSLAIQRICPEARTAIELGGQDAKMIFLAQDEQGEVTVSDMRMNGSCAGGTGAFIDEIASLLHIPVTEFDDLASKGTTVYDISGRCGVYAKTDIQPLMNRGAKSEDIALSSLHALVKQTIGGLAQGLAIEPPVVFLGGPLTFNPTLVKAFATRLNLAEGQVITPENAECAVAYGAALARTELFGAKDCHLNPDKIEAALYDLEHPTHDDSQSKGFFASDEELQAFKARHALPKKPVRPTSPDQVPGGVVSAYLGIDSGSTTTKFVLLAENGQLLDHFYATNEGDPLVVAKNALLAMYEDYRKAGLQLNILGVGTTGYGEQLFAAALHADTHVIETVAHARAVMRYIPDASFILDIGGQDMKAMWLEEGIITNILVNEACSSGCGSFLQTFAQSLNIRVQDIAELAFASKSPANLGSRCTVFMNSNIVTEQKNGKTPADIMAGLCKSIILNVFTKVIRNTKISDLGDHIVVQGGTFLNDAVVAAFEEYVGKQVIRAPYPELMGAIGAAIVTQEAMQERKNENPAATSSFVGFPYLQTFTYSQQADLICPFCTNHCNRTAVTFPDGSSWVTGNRCAKGEIMGDPKDQATRERLRASQDARSQVPNMFEEREKLLFKEYPVSPVLPEQGATIGLPRVLLNWEAAPFFTTFFRALGFKVIFSSPSTRPQYESGLQAVSSDTVCFPAKLVHGHIRDLAKKKPDYIFMPSITTVKSENTEESSFSMCAVVKGYPMVIRNSDNPDQQFGVPFLNPLFHWYTDEDRDKQLTGYMKKVFNIGAESTRQAIAQADAAQTAFADALEARGRQIMDKVEAEGRYAVVLASRPYQNDPLVNHDLPNYFIDQGIPVLTVDSVPGFKEVDLSHSLIDIANNFHARMLSCAILAAENPHLEYAQIVSFGCGHDAYLSDEIVRIMKTISGKASLVLKVDESDVPGPLRIRVRSFIETVNMRRAANPTLNIHPLPDPFPQKFEKRDKEIRTVLVPNTSHAFSMLMAAAFKSQGLNTVSLPVGRDRAAELGKKYVHNDICFPCQVVIGELLEALESGEYDPDTVAVCMGKYVGDCRLTHYTALLRKALDDAGFTQVPILTNDDVDRHNVHPGFKMNLLTAARIAFGLPMIDALEELLRKMRPYEVVKDSTQKAFDKALELTMKGMEKSGISGARKGFMKAIDIMKGVKYDRSKPKPTVLIVGEYLLNFHQGANHDIEAYLEDHGMEVIEAKMTDVIRKSYFYKNRQNREYKLNKSLSERALFEVEDNIFNLAHSLTDSIATRHPLYEPATRMQDLVEDSDPIIHHTFDAGEGVLIPGEILHHAKHGCRAFVILQPFGCLPNHIVGRGITKKLKELHPDSQILCLDFDPDAPLANIENRLQMLILNSLRAQGRTAHGQA